MALFTSPTGHVAIVVTSLLCMTVCMVFTLFFVAALFLQRAQQAALTLAAVVFQSFDLVGLASVLASKRSSGTTAKPSPARFLTILAVSLSTHAVSLAALCWLQLSRDTLTVSTFQHSAMAILYALWTAWAASLFSHGLFFFSWRSLRPVRVVPSEVVHDDVPTSSSSDQSTPPTELKRLGREAITEVYRSTTYPHDFSSSPTEPSPQLDMPSHYQLEDSPTRNSDPTKKHVLEHATSRTRLIRASSPSRTEEDSTLSPRNSSEFYDSPDLSHNDNGVVLSPSFLDRPVTPVKQRLEPIPGSNPNSPGRPLDIDKPASPQRPRPILEHKSSESSLFADESRVPPRFRSKSSLASLKKSPVVDESLIHPLFRTDSPLPPPTPLTTTTVTASAFGGLTMTVEDFQQRSGSRPTSPATVLTPSMPGSRRPSRERSASAGGGLHSANTSRPGTAEPPLPEPLPEPAPSAECAANGEPPAGLGISHSSPAKSVGSARSGESGNEADR